MFENFIGNNDILELIKSAVESGRFPHAFILEGEEGSGRRTLARIIAAAAVCKEQNAPCGHCRECELVTKDGHSDVLTYAPDGATFKVDMVRNIRDNAFIMPIEAKRKVNILLDCDKMNESAQNAFLKILEEPPSFLVFILICRNASALLPTVRSRCVTLTLKTPDPEDSLNLIKIKTGHFEDDIREALELTHGNIGKAINYLYGNISDAIRSAREFINIVDNGTRLDAVKIMQCFEKDRSGLGVFFEETEVTLKEYLKNYSVSGNCVFSKKALVKFLECTQKYRDRLLKHVGAPLSLPILCTAFVAEIFG